MQLPKVSRINFLRALTRSFFVILLALMLQFLAPNLTHGANPLSAFLSKLQNGSLDMLMSLVYHVKLDSPEPINETVPIWFIGLDSHYERNRLDDENNNLDIGIPRMRLAHVVENIEKLNPRAIFLDFDIEKTTNESNIKSEGDKKLIEVLNSSYQGFPILIPSQTIAGDSIMQNQKLCAVSSDLVWDGDGLVRRVALAQNNVGDKSVIFYLHYLATSKSNSNSTIDCDTLNTIIESNFGGVAQNASANDRIDSRVIFRNWRWNSGNPNVSSISTSGDSRWTNGYYASAEALLDGSLGSSTTSSLENAIFIVGYSNAYSNQTKDKYWTPVGILTGAEVHFHGLMTLLHHHSDSAGNIFLAQPIMVFSYIAMFLIIFFVSLWLKDLDNLLEFILIWCVIVFPAIYLLNRFGFFVDYVVPLFCLELLASIRGVFSNLRKKEIHG